MYREFLGIHAAGPGDGNARIYLGFIRSVTVSAMRDDVLRDAESILDHLGWSCKGWALKGQEAFRFRARCTHPSGTECSVWWSPVVTGGRCMCSCHRE